MLPNKRYLDSSRQVRCEVVQLFQGGRGLRSAERDGLQTYLRPQ